MTAPAPFDQLGRHKPRHDAEVMKRFTMKPTRHMIYHIWPYQKETNNWKWNLDYLKVFIDQFDTRSIAVVTNGDGSTASFEDVKAYMQDVRIDNWFHKVNDPQTREGVTFIDLMETLPKGDNDITWYGHAKGVRHAATSYIPLIWAMAQYELALNPPLNLDPKFAGLDIVEEHLQMYPITGLFKRHDEFNLPRHDRWHYSGTSYWFRNYSVFNNPEWRDFAPNFFACIEAWPARLFDDQEGGCLFGDGTSNLYNIDAWQQLRSSLYSLGITYQLEGDN